MTVESFLDGLVALRSCHAFNPYRDVCEVHDSTNGPEIRRRNLRLVLHAAMEHHVETLWVARDLGYRGGRRTGLALTDEAHLASHGSLYGRLPLEKATRGPLMAERTAKVVWSAICEVDRPVFLWNVFPLHPHAPGDPLSNRCHTRAERNSSAHLLQWLVDALRPKTIVAIGGDAAAALADFQVPAIAVRHPSYGGQREFLAGIATAHGLAHPQHPATQTLFDSGRHNAVARVTPGGPQEGIPREHFGPFASAGPADVTEV